MKDSKIAWTDQRWARGGRWPEHVTFDAFARVYLRDRKHGGDPEEWPEDLRVRQLPGPARIQS